MVKDKFSALWLSYSSISDFLSCPKAYYYAYIYKNPRTGRKIAIINPPLALGHVVHSVLDMLSTLPVEKRFIKPLEQRLHTEWEKISGEKGGFRNPEEEENFKQRGLEMIKKISINPGPIAKKAVKIKEDVPYYWFSVEENMILCGKIDWIEYLEDSDSVHIIDFKTGQREEKDDSLQFPIYYLLAKNCQSRDISKMSYWYLSKSEELQEVILPDEKDSYDRIMKVGLRIKLAKQLNHYKCSKDEKMGCFACAPYEAIIKGKGKFVGINDFGKEVYILLDEQVSL